MSEKITMTIKADEIGVISTDELVKSFAAPETEALPKPTPKYDPNDPEFRKAVIAVVLGMKRKRVI